MVSDNNNHNNHNPHHHNNNHNNQMDKDILNKMKWQPFNKVLVYLCQKLKDKYATITIGEIRDKLHLSHHRIWEIFRDLRSFGYIKQDRKSNLGSYIGIFECGELKLKKYETMAKRLI